MRFSIKHLTKARFVSILALYMRIRVYPQIHFLVCSGFIDPLLVQNLTAEDTRCAMQLRLKTPSKAIASLGRGSQLKWEKTSLSGLYASFAFAAESIYLNKGLNIPSIGKSIHCTENLPFGHILMCDYF